MRRSFLIALVFFAACSDAEVDPPVTGPDFAGLDVGTDASDVSDAEPDPSVDIADVPPTDVGPDLEVADIPSDPDAEITDASRELADRLVVPGACTNLADMEFIEGERWHLVRRRCADRCESDTECFGRCLAGPEQLSQGCSDCYQRDAVCRTQCGEGCLLECNECWSDLCEPEFLLCAGVLSPPAEFNPGSPGRACLQADVGEVLASESFADAANGCASGCTNSECTAQCIEAETLLFEECSECVATWLGCSRRTCGDLPAFEFSQERLTCEASAECLENFLVCVGRDSISFAEQQSTAVEIRVSASPTLLQTSLVVVETGRPLLRNLRSGVVTGFFAFTLGLDEFPIGVTAGPIGPAAELLAEVPGEFVDGRAHTVHVYSLADEVRAHMLIEPRFSANSIRVFNGRAGSVRASVDADGLVWDLESGEMGEDFEALSPLDLRLDDGLVFRIPDFGGATAFVVWLIEADGGTIARVTTSRGGFATLEPEVE